MSIRNQSTKLREARQREATNPDIDGDYEFQREPIMKRLPRSPLFIALLACAIASPVLADTATDINRANALVREGKIDEAIQSYSTVTPNGQVQHDLDYNLAVAKYRSGDIESVRTMFTSASTSSDAKIASAARYNLGNCYYSDAVSQAKSDKPAAIESLQQAIGHYKGSLAGNPNHVDARANIELAGQWIKQLKQEEQQQNQPQQEQPKQEQDQQQQQEPSQQDQANQDQANQDQSSASQDQSSPDAGAEAPDQQDSQQDDSQQNAADQDNSSKDNPSQENSSQDNPSQENSSQNNSSQNNSSPQQTASNANPDQPSRGADEQDPAAGNLEEDEMADDPLPEGELTYANDQQVSDQKPNASAAMAGPNSQDELMSKEEALKMLQSVRDRDMLRRLRQDQIQRRRHIPTDRDW